MVFALDLRWAEELEARVHIPHHPVASGGEGGDEVMKSQVI
jgi:hypothetical protein